VLRESLPARNDRPAHRHGGPVRSRAIRRGCARARSRGCNGEGARMAGTRPAAAGPRGSRSSAPIRWTWSCSRPNGAAGGARAGSPICIWVRAIRRAAASSCWARPSRA
jgi:hypothetical protein